MAPPAGPRFDKPDRKLHGVLERCQPAARRHQQDRAIDTHRAEPVAQPGQVARHQRTDIGVGARRRKSLVLADFGADFGRNAERHIRQPGRQKIAGAAFVIGIGIGVHITNGHAFDFRSLEFRDERFDHALVERLQDLARQIDALRHGQAQFPRHQRGRLLDHDVVLVVAALVADLEDVAKPFRRHKRGLGALAFEDRIRRQGRAVQHQRQSACIQAGLGQRRLDAVDDAFFWGGRRGQHLRRRAMSLGFQNDIRERTADIDREPRCRTPFRHALSSGKKFGFSSR